MVKLAIVDLDMVVCDNTKRFEKAEEARLQCMIAEGAEKYLAPGTYTKAAVDAYWREVFNPELVTLDTLIEGVDEALYHLEEEVGYHVVFLTSRPESMRKATLEWLLKYLDESLMSWDVVMKQPAFQYVKTVTWKVGMVQMLHKLFDADEVVFVDDEPNNRQAVLDAYPDGGDFGIVKVYGSLVEAVASLQQEAQ